MAVALVMSILSQAHVVRSRSRPPSSLRDRCHYHWATRRTVSQLLFTAFSNRADAVQLAREAGRQLEGDGISTSLHLLDVDEAPDVDALTLVVSLGGDGTFLKSSRLAHAMGARVLAVYLGRLGFLLNVPSTEVVEDAKAALTGHDVVERLALLISASDSTLEEFA